jgi:hypothetical protein
MVEQLDELASEQDTGRSQVIRELLQQALNGKKKR